MLLRVSDWRPNFGVVELTGRTSRAERLTPGPWLLSSAYGARIGTTDGGFRIGVPLLIVMTSGIGALKCSITWVVFADIRLNVFGMVVFHVPSQIAVPVVACKSLSTDFTADKLVICLMDRRGRVLVRSSFERWRKVPFEQWYQAGWVWLFEERIEFFCAARNWSTFMTSIEHIGIIHRVGNVHDRRPRALR